MSLKRIITAGLLLFIFALPAGARRTELYCAYSAPCGEAADSTYGVAVPEGAEPLSQVDKLPTAIVGSSPKLEDRGGAVSVGVDGRRGSVSLMFDTYSEDGDSAAIEMPSAVGFCLLVPAEEGDADRSASVSMRLKCGDDVYTYRVNAAVGVPTLAVCDTSELSGRTLEKITLSVSCSDLDAVPDRIYTSQPFLPREQDFSFLRENGLSSLSVISGDAYLEGGKLMLRGGEGAVISVSASDEADPSASDDGGRVVYLSAKAQSGEAVVSLSESEGSGSTPTAVAEGGELNLRLICNDKRWSARFSVRPTSEQGAVFESMKFVPTDEYDTPEKHVITSMTYADGKLNVEGRLDEAAAKEYLGEKLMLYMCPAVGDGENIQLDSVSASTRFSFKVSLEKYGAAVYQNMFFVGVEADEGEVTVLSEPRFASLKNSLSVGGRAFGLYGAKPVSVYDSGAPKVMVEVDLSKLMSAGTTSGSTVTRGGYVFGVRSKYAKELDADIGFYASSGTSVYLKFICTEPIRSSNGGWLVNFDRERDEYLVLVGTDEGMNYFLAAVGYLCDRYPNIESIVISSGINSESLAVGGAEDIYGYASDVALLARLAYGVAMSYGEEVFITVPFAEEDTFISTELFGALFAEKLTSLGQIPWAPMYTVTGEEDRESADPLSVAAKINGRAGPSYSVVCLVPTGDASALADEYKAVYDNVNGAGVMAVFLSLKEHEAQLKREDFRRLRQVMEDGEALLVYGGTVTKEEAASLSFIGRHTRWDFKSLYSTDGWRAGYGISSLSTVQSEGGMRVLRCVTEPDGGESSGIMLCTPDSPLILTAAPYAEFVYSYSSDSSVQITFLFGSGKNRIELTGTEAEELPDGRYRCICDLSEFAKAGPVGYVGIIIGGTGQVTFDLSEVSFLSETYTDTEITELLIHSTTGNGVGKISLRALTVAVLGGIFGVFVFTRVLVIFIRQDRRSANTKGRKRTNMDKL